jgi:predicted DNA-binding transcriptional regulator AlpA
MTRQIVKTTEQEISGEDRIRAGRRGAFVPDTVAADLIGTTPATMRRWRHERRGPKYFKIGSLVRYAVGDIEDWADARIVEPMDVA